MLRKRSPALELSLAPDTAATPSATVLVVIDSSTPEQVEVPAPMSATVKVWTPGKTERLEVAQRSVAGEVATMVPAEAWLIAVVAEGVMGTATKDDTAGVVMADDGKTFADVTMPAADSVGCSTPQAWRSSAVTSGRGV